MLVAPRQGPVEDIQPPDPKAPVVEADGDIQDLAPKLLVIDRNAAGRVVAVGIARAEI